MADARGSIPPPTSRAAAQPPAPAAQSPPEPSPRRPAVWPIVAVVLAAAGMAVAVVLQAGRWSEHVDSPVERDQARVAELVETYLAARGNGDGRTACAQLSEGQRRELVARVSEQRMVDAAPSRCDRLAPNVSPHSRFTSPELDAYRGHEVEVRVAPSGIAEAHPAGLPGPRIMAWKREDGWQLDGAAMLGATFLTGCRAQGASDSYCGCVFDEARARNPARPRRVDNAIALLWKRMVTGSKTPLLRSIIETCGANEVQAAEGAGRSQS